MLSTFFTVPYPIYLCYMKIRVSFLALLLCLTACQLINPDEELPVYISIQDARVLVDETLNTYSPLGIKDAWLFLQSEQIGIFELPAVVPILPEKVGNTLRIGGGIFDTGLSTFRVEYPFWDDISVSIEGVEPLDTVVITPRFEYFPRDTTIIYAFEAGFEGGSSNLESLTPASTFTTLQITSEDKFVGLQSGKVSFSPNKYQFEASSPLLTLPQSGNNAIWCEVTYKNDIPFTVLMIGLAPGSPIEVELPTNVLFSSPDEWNTAYINLNDLARSIPDGSVFKLLFRASSQEAGSATGRTGTIFLDQIRLIHFN